MKKAMGETERRRAKQIAYNAEHGITPRGIVKQVRDLIDGVYSEKSGRDAERLGAGVTAGKSVDEVAMSEKDLAREIKRLEKQMLEHARNLEFEQAARVRDQLAHLKSRIFGAAGEGSAAA
jgi:excinuclease ABC subunit B